MSAQSFIGVFQYSRRAIELVWQTSRPLTCWMAILTLIAGAMPAAIAYVGKLIGCRRDGHGRRLDWLNPGLYLRGLGQAGGGTAAAQR